MMDKKDQVERNITLTERLQSLTPEKKETIVSIIKGYLVKTQGQIAKVLQHVGIEDNDANRQVLYRWKQELIDMLKIEKIEKIVLSQESLDAIKSELETCIALGGKQELIAEKYGISVTKLSRLKKKWFPESVISTGQDRIDPNVKKRIQSLLTSKVLTYQDIANETGVSISTVYTINKEFKIRK